MIPVIVGVVALAAGVVVGFLIRANIAKSSANTLEAQARQKLIEAEREARRGRPRGSGGPERANEDAKSEAAQVRRDAEDDVKSRRDEIARLERRISQSEEDLRERTRKLDQRGAELDERDGMLHDARMQLEKAADQHRTQLERVAGMTSSEAREESVAHVVDDAKRAAMAPGPRDRAAGPRGGRGAGPQDRDDRDPARRLRADRGVHRQRLRPAERGHEGPDHRPRGPQHPRLRGDDRGQHHHRRHARGRGAVSSFDPVRREVGADDAREARPATAGSTPRGSRRSTSGRTAEIEERIRRAGEDAVAEVGITDVHPEMVELLGRLQYRTSYGQNVLRHLVESRPHRRRRSRPSSGSTPRSRSEARSCTTSARP